MSIQILTPTQQVADGGGLDLTALLATPTATTLQFTNTGRETLYVAAGSTSETVTVDIGALVEGETVSNFTAVSLTNGHTVMFGEFHSILDQSGTNLVQVTLSTITSITVALVQSVGVS